MKRFLVDENVNQQVIRAIPAAQKGFDFLYPETGGFKGAGDSDVKKRSVQDNRVLVTCDRDFDMPIDQVPCGVLWIRPSPRVSQRRVGELIGRFCSFVQNTFPSNPYDFEGKMFEIEELGVTITTKNGKTSHIF
jgi:predicted nuclease of predicted toxin-antitoxin system